MLFDDTILALSSPPSGGATLAPRAILRLSGPNSWPLARHLIDQDLRLAWQPVLLTALRLNLPAAVLAFRAPRSFTGEDLIELHLPNAPALIALLTDHILDNARQQSLPARLANPGEFTARAFFNAKLDLTEAEGIAATIAAASQTELRAAARLLQGDLHRWINALAQQLANTLALVEAGIDFADENLELLPAAQLTQTLENLHAQIHDQLAQALRIDRLAELPTIVFIGRPNVGKSSLINALSQSDRSIVSPIAGTTRDVLSAIMQVGPLPEGNGQPPFSGDATHRQIRLLDVPGEETPTTDLQSQMMATRQAALLDADLIVEVLDTPTPETPGGSPELDRPLASLSSPPLALAPGGSPELGRSPVLLVAIPVEDAAPRLVIYNKSDLHPAPQNIPPWQHVSAKHGTHIPELRLHLAHLVAPHATVAASRIVLNHRHRELLAQAAARLTAAHALDPAAHAELLAAELRRALDLLGQITGTISPDEVLSRIFSQFCIGK